MSGVRNILKYCIYGYEIRNPKIIYISNIFTDRRDPDKSEDLRGEDL